MLSSRKLLGLPFNCTPQKTTEIYSPCTKQPSANYVTFSKNQMNIPIGKQHR